MITATIPPHQTWLADTYACAFQGLETLRPLVVDLDGTLIHTDMLHESALKVFRESPWSALLLPVWLLQGKAVLKQRLAQRTAFNAGVLPYNQTLIDWLREQKQLGREIVLCTASDQRFAEAIAEQLGLFDSVLASDGQTNLSGRQKAQALVDRYGEQGFDYAGNSTKDLPVWASAHQAVVVNASTAVTERAQQCARVETVFPPAPTGIMAWLKVVRAHQWLKNLLLFFPAIAAHDLNDPAILGVLALAFCSFSLCASAVYITNDLTDLESDRLHPRKRNRPFASGAIAAWKGVLLSPMLLLGSVVIGSLVSMEFLGWLAVYFLLTLAYSFGLKRLMIVDCLVLAMLYTLRIIAGAAASENALTFWLLTESVFLFLSLAFVKRYAELKLQSKAGASQAHGRGYLTSDAPLIQNLGISAGFIAVLVLALYLNSDSVLGLYQNTALVWAAIPILLFWISWMWMQANRGNMNDDPLVFAVKDKTSLMAGAAFALVLALATLGWP
ncbi:UbiA family prenyltransferase [Pseudohongiella sp. SYSU M77423]|uniref:UbiA family prenyltransferase n=1 Tax=unclassified Pseudohongiella TaxID=2629611 RepID=UPI00235149DB|nr:MULTISPECIES: UbiA family prenyltransferase [unclassified Pseudohongiella]MDH7944028.1 UbiA family prenyltransferase [Pseudohongiella sp. SYSU M77423]